MKQSTAIAEKKSPVVSSVPVLINLQHPLIDAKAHKNFQIYIKTVPGPVIKINENISLIEPPLMKIESSPQSTKLSDCSHHVLKNSKKSNSSSYIPSTNNLKKTIKPIESINSKLSSQTVDNAANKMPSQKEEKKFSESDHNLSSNNESTSIIIQDTLPHSKTTKKVKKSSDSTKRRKVLDIISEI